MKIHLQQIPDEGKHFEGEANPAILELSEPYIVPESPVRYSLDVGISEGGLFATGSLELDLRLRCVRCLDEFPFPVRIRDFACQVELTGNETVDLTPLAREDILLALPAHPHCDWDGQKPCEAPVGGLLNRGSEPSPNPQDGNRTSAVWGQLDQLNFEKE
jgi:uncharacterized metal-binding protein YceD (DUF177 family)